MKRFISLLVLLAVPSAHAVRDWTTFEDCTLIEDPANDGDSFHVRYKEREYVVRLYFVDCPETDSRYPDRVKEQGDYFGGLSEKETMRVGKKATEFTEKWLKGGSFTMHTRYEDAQGASSKKRYYVWIEKDDKILAEDLVRQLNQYFTRMVDVVFAHRGTVDKFVGDMVMALYGAPLDDADHVYKFVISSFWFLV